MYVAVASTALRLIRCLRCQRATFALPAREVPEPRLVLGEGDASRASRSVKFSTPAPPCLSGRTLRESDLAADEGNAEVLRLGQVVANARVDFSVIGEVGKFDRDDPCHLGVFSRARRVTRRYVRTHLLSPNLPEEAVIVFDGKVSFASPELAVIQMAAQADAIQLAQVIMELCGTYSLWPTAGDDAFGRGVEYGLSPVMSLASLGEMSRWVHTPSGRRTLHGALAIAREGAASPAEANLSLIMGLPMGEGGYDMGFPHLNVHLEVPASQRPHVQGSDYYLDAFWVDCLADLEYESAAFHLDPLASLSQMEFDVWRATEVTKADRDRRRARELMTLGVLVIPVTKFDFRSLSRMDQVAWALTVRRREVGGVDTSGRMQALDRPAYVAARLRLLERLSPGVAIGA